MFVIFEQIRPAFRNYRRSPYVRILLIVVAVHLLLFVFTPPFHFQPYELAAQDTMTVTDIPVWIPPPEPEQEPALPFDPEPWFDDDAPDIDPPVTSPPDFGQLRKIPTQKTSPSSRYFWWDKAPVPTKLVRPVYPDLARQAGIEGVVQILVTIGIDGKVHNARVISSDVTDAMTRAALAAARMCEFEAAEQQGKKVRVSVVIPFEFRLTTNR
jgi:protein TonB